MDAVAIHCQTMRSLASLGLSVIVGVGAVVLLVWFAQRSLIYFPARDTPTPEVYGLPQAEIVRVTTDDGVALTAWYVPAPHPIRSTWTVVVFNGNAGHRGHRAGLATRLAAQGHAVLLMDYRGYGGNPGTPTEEGLVRDARAVWAHLASRPDVDMARVAYFGESLGAGVAVQLAVAHPPAALILRSPFSSLAAIGRTHYPWLPVRWLLRDQFASLDHMAHLDVPLLIIAGDADRIIPLGDTQRLFDAARSRKRLVVIAGADHNDAALVWGPEVMQAVTELLSGTR
jgi:fermentation-respiration switch protein FrsA (DUF1100 family)